MSTPIFEYPAYQYPEAWSRDWTPRVPIVKDDTPTQPAPVVKLGYLDTMKKSMSWRRVADIVIGPALVNFLIKIGDRRKSGHFAQDGK